MAEPYNEPPELLSEEGKDYFRAIQSMIEEMQAIEWYNQRVEATKNVELAGILAHNRDEEKEHATMLLEWLRRRDPSFSKELKEYMFTEGDLLEAESGED